jgi:hypothetical protein
MQQKMLLDVVEFLGCLGESWGDFSRKDGGVKRRRKLQAAKSKHQRSSKIQISNLKQIPNLKIQIPNKLKSQILGGILSRLNGL